ncbi:YadA-like family protein [Paraburkholderia hiiakae]|nr:YadA-like family protein [Paraburkholderia hiiakae]
MALANGTDALSIGQSNQAIGDHALAVGDNSTVSGVNSAGYGSAVSVNGNFSDGFGSGSTVSANNSVALGSMATVSVANAVAIGYGSVANTTGVATASGVIGGTTYNYAGGAPVGVVSVGSAGNARQITNVAAGQVTAASTDAVNGSQLYAADSQITNIINGTGSRYFKAAGNNDGSDDAQANAYGTIAIGPNAAAVRSGKAMTDAIAIGDGATATYMGNTALGGHATAGGGGSVAIGGNAITLVADGNNAMSAVGAGAAALAGNSTVLGGYATATGNNAVVLGAAASASQTNAIAVGFQASASTANSVALGNGATTAAAVTTASGTIGGTTYTYAGGTPTGVMSVGTAGATRQITNVAAGQITATSTDAVNGSELYATNTRVTADANSITTLQGQMTTVQGQVTTLQGNVTTINGQITNMQGQLANAVMYDSSAHSSVTLGGVGSTKAVALHNVANGALSATSTDAVNGSQLYATNTNVTNLSNTVNNINNGGGIKYFHTNSALNDSSATGTNSTAIGPVASASGTSAIAMGQASTSTGTSSVALGTNSQALANYAQAIGSSALASGMGDIALGGAATAAGGGSEATAIGMNSKAIATGTVVLGAGATASQVNATSLGYQSTAAGQNSTSIGTNAVASNTNSIALGYGANASTANSVALGNGATTAAAVTTASGTIGGTTYTYAGGTPTGVMSVGTAGATRQITNVAAGQITAASTDAVNGSELYATNTQVTANTNSITTLQGNVTTINGQITSMQGSITNINGKLADAVMYDSSAHSSVTLGGVGSTTAVALHNVANGALSATSTDAVNGSQLNATNTNVTNLSNTVNNINNGGGIKYFHTNSALNDSSATGTNSTAIGPVASASGTNAIAIGNGANATDANSVALGNGATTAAAVGTASGTIGGTVYTYAGTSPTGTVSVGTAGAERTITNVAAGRVTATSTDAVNGSELYATNSKVTQNTSDISNIYSEITTLTGGAIDAVMYDSSAHTSVTLGGTGASSAVALHNVANGALSASSTDAVNGSQLYATNTNVSNLAGNVTTLQGNITSINGQITNINGKLNDAVLYDSSAHASVTLGGTGASSAVALHNVANGVLSASSFDAVNGSQLYATNTNVSNLAGNVTTLQGNVTTLQGNITSINGQITNINGKLNDAVLYDSSAHTSVTLGGTGASSAVALHNVANGVLSASSFDAVNGSQLYATNTNVSNLAGNVTTLQGNVTTLQGNITSINGQITNINGKLNDAVLYDSSAHTSVTLGGTGASSAVALHNVANGVLSASSFDAVNGSQLYATNTSVSNLAGNVTTLEGNITNINGKLNDAVVYDSSAHSSVTLGGAGSTTPVALHNVAAGEVSASSFDAVNGSQLYALGSSTADALGGGSTVNSDGSISAPTYNVGGDTYNNVGGAITNIDGRVTQNTSDIQNITNNINNGTIGLVQQDPTSRNITVAKDTDGSIVDFTGTAGTRVLTGVSAGAVNASSVDAVNGSQLYATNANVSNLAGNVTTLEGNITNINGKLGDAVLYDSSAHTSVTLGGTGASSAVALHNVANGVLSASSFDAVNGSQLYALGSSTADALGGGSTVNSDGSISAPTYNVGGDTYNNVGGAITNLDGRVTQNTSDIQNITNNINNGTIGLVQQDPTSRNITVAKDTDGSIVDFTGTAGTRVLTGVSNGAVNASSVDAVNGSQLYNLASSTADSMGGGSTVNSDGSITNPTYIIGGKTFNNAGDAFTQLNGDITNINGTMADAVMYDSSAHDSVTFGGVGSTTPVALHNVAAGEVSASSFDAVNGSQLYALGSSTADALGGGSTVNSDGSISAPTYNVGGDTYNNVGGAITNLDGRVTQNTSDIQNITNNINNGTIGLVQQDPTTRNITVAKDTDGSIVDFTGTAGTRVLTGVSNGAVNASSVDAVNGSQLYNLASSTADSMGGGSTVNSDGSITNPTYIIGGKTFNNAGDAFTQLNGDITNINGTMADAVMYDSSAHDSVTFGGVGSTTPVALHNVAAGEVSASSFDAVNGSQLYTLANSTADAFGGGSTVNSDGSISAPTYNVGGDTYNNVGGAITNLDGRVTQNTSDIQNITNNINNGTIGLVQQDPTSRNITVAKDTDGSIVDFTGTAGTRVLTGVSAGAVNASSVDAVNGSQLYALGSSTADALGGGSTVNSDGSISAPTYNVGGDTYNNVGGAITNLDGRVTQNTTDISNLQGDITNINGQMADAVMYDSSAHDSVTFGGVGSTTPVALHNVADGLVNASSFDAVNGSQLYNLASSTASAIGGGSTVNGNGSISNPTFILNGGTYTNVAGAITNLDGRVTQNTTDISNLQGDITNINGTMANAVMYDSSAKDSITLGGSDSTKAVTIHNVAAGVADTDAVNVGQMNAAIADVTNIAQNATDPMFSAQGDRNTEAAQATGTHATAGGANSVASGSQSTAMGAGANATGNQTTAIGAGSTASAANSVALGANSVADRANTVSVGSAGNERQVTNVAAGTAGTDAVNVSQLNDAVSNATGSAVQQATQQSNAYTNQQIGIVRKQVNTLGAAAMAASSLIPNARAEGNFQMAAAAGTYGGESALALGANWYVSDRLLLNAHVSKSTGGGSVGASVGATFGF